MLQSNEVRPGCADSLTDDVFLTDSRVCDSIASFPLDGFNKMIQDYILNVAEVSGTSIDRDSTEYPPIVGAVACSCLSVLGAVIAPKRKAIFRGDDGNEKYKVVPNIYSCFVCDSTGGKSIAIKTPTEPLSEINRQLLHRYNEAVKNLDPNDMFAEQPKKKRFTIGETTPQAIVKNLSNNCNSEQDMDCGTLLLNDEFSGIFKQMDDAKGTDFKTLLCNAFDGGSYTSNRATRDDISINNIMLSVSGAIQTNMLRKRLNDDMFAVGLFQRFMWVFGDGMIQQKCRHGLNESLRRYWSQTILDIFNLETCETMEYSESASRLFWEWCDNCYLYELEKGDSLTTQFLEKQSYFVLRLALIFAVAHKQSQIEYEDMKNAIKVCNYLLTQDLQLLSLGDFCKVKKTDALKTFIEVCAKDGKKVNYTKLAEAIGQRPEWGNDMAYQIRKNAKQKAESTAKNNFFSIAEFNKVDFLHDDLQTAYQGYCDLATAQGLDAVPFEVFSKKVDKSKIFKK